MSILVLFELTAKKLKPFQNISRFLAASLIAMLVIPLLLPNQLPFGFLDIHNEYGKLVFITSIWLLLLNIIVMVFDGISQEVTNKKFFFKFIAYKIKRFCYVILAFLFVFLTLAILILSIRLLRV